MLNILLVVGSGVLASFLFPPYEVWWFGWLYLLPLLIALRRTSEVRAAGWLMLLFGLVFHAATLTWIISIFSAGALGIFLLMSLLHVLFGVGYRALAERHRWPVAVLMAAVLWVALDWVRCEGWYFQFSWAQLGFTFASCRRGGILYPHIGVYGATFLLVLVNALLAEIMLTRRHWLMRLAAFAGVAMPVILLSLYINTPVGSPVRPEELGAKPLRISLVQDESGVLDTLKTHTLELRTARPDLIVWPEYAISQYPLSEPKVMAELAGIAKTMKSTLIVGCKEHVPQGIKCDWMRKRAMLLMEGELFANSALILDPTGKLLGTYHKTHPIPFFSDGVPGKVFPTFTTPVGRLGLAICYDFDFAATAVRLVRNGAELLVVPTFDSLAWSDTQHVQHARMAQARAAEVERWVVRTTTSGISQLINPYGQVIANIPNAHSGRTMTYAVPRHTRTPYIQYSFLLPYLCLVVTLAWGGGQLLLAWRRRRSAVMSHQKSESVVC